MPVALKNVFTQPRPIAAFHEGQLSAKTDFIDYRQLNIFGMYSREIGAYVPSFGAGPN